MKPQERPILYSTPMIRAKLDRRKTQTRRTLKVQPEAQLYPCGTGKWYWSTDPSDLKIHYVKCPYGQVGDVLWSREAWNHALDQCGNPNGDSFGKYLYRASGDGGKWKPSIHQPKIAARIWERITDIRVERLQDISEEDAIAEGIEFRPHSELPELTVYRDYSVAERDRFAYGKGWGAKESYLTLWESINGEGSWNVNPWLWVIQSEILSTTGRPKELSDELILNTPER